MIEIKDTGGLTMSEWRRKIEAGEEFTPDEQRQIEKFRKSMSVSLDKLLPSVKILKNVAKIHQDAVAKAFAAVDLVKPMVESMRKMQERVSEIARSFSEMFNRMRENFAELGKRIWNGIRKSFEALSVLIEESHIFLIVKTSKGDPPSADKLARLWCALAHSYRILSRREGREPTADEVRALFIEACWRFLNSEKAAKTPLTEVASKVYWSIFSRLKVDWAEVHKSDRNVGGWELDILADSTEQDSSYIPVVSIHHDDQGKPYLFTEEAAKAVGTTPQSIRNWAKEGKIEMVYESYQSKIRRKFIKVGLLPYKGTLIAELIRLKEENEDRRRHRVDGYYTISQMSEESGASQSTLKRWEKDRELVPERIRGIRCYTENDVETAVKLLATSSSPRVRAKIRDLARERGLSLVPASY